jgi:CHASE3 domain sensor protein
MQLSGKRSLTLLIMMPVLLLVELAIGWGIFTNVKRTTAIEADINKLNQYLITNTKYISGGESAQRGYLLTADTKFYDTYINDIKEWVKNEEYYHTLPDNLKRVEANEIEWLSRQKISDLGLAIQLYNKGDKISSTVLIKAGYSALTDSIRAKSTRLSAETGNAIIVQRNRQYKLIYAFFAVIAVLIVFSLILAWITYIAFRDYTTNLEKTVQSLEAANQTLLQYNFNSYHSLKTPLRNINGFMQILQRKYQEQFDTEAKEYVQYITVAVKQLNTIIDNMRHQFLESDKDKDKDE